MFTCVTWNNNNPGQYLYVLMLYEEKHLYIMRYEPIQNAIF